MATTKIYAIRFRDPVAFPAASELTWATDAHYDIVCEGQWYRVRSKKHPEAVRVVHVSNVVFHDESAPAAVKAAEVAT